MFTWDTIQQVIRIVAYPVSGWLMAKGWPEDMTTALMGGATLIGSVVWWWVWNKKKTDEVPAEEPVA